MSEDHQERVSRMSAFEHDDITDLVESGDLYERTESEKVGRGFWKRIKNMLEIKKEKQSQKEWDFPYSENGFEDEVFEKNPGLRCAALSHILWQKEHGKIFDTIRYENFLKQSFKTEKMIFGDENANLYFLILGLNEGILSLDTALSMAGNNSEYGEFFADKSSWKKDGKIVSKGTPGAEHRGWNVSDFAHWKEFVSPGEGTEGFFAESIAPRMKKFHEEIIQKSEMVQARKLRDEKNEEARLNVPLAA